MRILLDTHTYLLWLSSELAEIARTKISLATDVFVSAASIWEASILIHKGKLDNEIGTLVRAIEQNGFKELPVTAAHAAMVAHLPDLNDDEFDRILISQAVCDRLYFFTHDEVLVGYSELVVLI
ncbi:MAG: type II toxin-antitoxin system VapC family toxin [bacterium]|nr:type II toxin-antitoxin system VapC family toxin [bacterium]